MSWKRHSIPPVWAFIFTIIVIVALVKGCHAHAQALTNISGAWFKFQRPAATNTPVTITAFLMQTNPPFADQFYGNYHVVGTISKTVTNKGVAKLDLPLEGYSRICYSWSNASGAAQSDWLQFTNSLSVVSGAANAVEIYWRSNKVAKVEQAPTVKGPWTFSKNVVGTNAIVPLQNPMLFYRTISDTALTLKIRTVRTNSL